MAVYYKHNIYPLFWFQIQTLLFKMLFKHCDSFFTQYSNIIFYRDIKLLKQVTKHLNYFSYIITNIQNDNLPLTESQLYCLFYAI